MLRTCFRAGALALASISAVALGGCDLSQVQQVPAAGAVVVQAVDGALVANKIDHQIPLNDTEVVYGCGLLGAAANQAQVVAQSGALRNDASTNLSVSAGGAANLAASCKAGTLTYGSASAELLKAFSTLKIESAGKVTAPKIAAG